MPTQYDDLVRRFSIHAPTPEQRLAYTEIHDRALRFALRLSVLVPPGRELATALTKLDEVVMFATAGIARDTKDDSEADTAVDAPVKR